MSGSSVPPDSTTSAMLRSPEDICRSFSARRRLPRIRSLPRIIRPSGPAVPVTRSMSVRASVWSRKSASSPVRSSSTRARPPDTDTR